MTVKSLLGKNNREIFGTEVGYWMTVPCPCQNEDIIHVLNAYLERMESDNIEKKSEVELIKAKSRLEKAKILDLDVVVDYVIAELVDGFDIAVETLPEKIRVPLYNEEYDLVDEEKKKLTNEEKLEVKLGYVTLCADGKLKAEGRLQNVSERIKGLESLIHEFKGGSDLAEMASCKVHGKDYLSAVVTNIGQKGAMPAVLIYCDTQHQMKIFMKKLTKRFEDGSKIRDDDIEEFNLSQGGVFNYRMVGYACGCGNIEARKPKTVPFWVETRINTTQRRPSYKCRACESLIGISFPHRGTFKLYDPDLIKSEIPLENYI
jgi:hypothetical protein